MAASADPKTVDEDQQRKRRSLSIAEEYREHLCHLLRIPNLLRQWTGARKVLRRARLVQCREFVNERLDQV
jgi:hypothetical protein